MSRHSYTHVFLAVIPVLLAGLVWLAGGIAHQRANAAIVSDAGPLPPTSTAAPTGPSPPPAPSLETFTTRVQPGDSLSRIFQRHGLPARDLHLLVESGPLGKRLKNIYPGYEIEFGRDAQDNLVHLKYRPGRWETVEFQRVGDEFEGSTKFKEPDSVRRYSHASISHSLFLS